MNNYSSVQSKFKFILDMDKISIGDYVQIYNSIQKVMQGKVINKSGASIQVQPDNGLPMWILFQSYQVYQRMGDDELLDEFERLLDFGDYSPDSKPLKSKCVCGVLKLYPKANPSQHYDWCPMFESKDYTHKNPRKK